MFEVVILVCSVSIAPADCQTDNAIDVIRGPDVANELMCGLHGQAYIASTALSPQSTDEYVKVQCKRSPEEAVVEVPVPGSGEDFLAPTATYRERADR